MDFSFEARNGSNAQHSDGLLVQHTQLRHWRSLDPDGAAILQVRSDHSQLLRVQLRTSISKAGARIDKAQYSYHRRSQLG